MFSVMLIQLINFLLINLRDPRWRFCFRLNGVNVDFNPMEFPRCVITCVDDRGYHQFCMRTYIWLLSHSFGGSISKMLLSSPFFIFLHYKVMRADNKKVVLNYFLFLANNLDVFSCYP